LSWGQFAIGKKKESMGDFEELTESCRYELNQARAR
jgi:hypothetical protein